MAHKKARVGDKMIGRWRKNKRVSGRVSTGSPNVYVNGRKCARKGDKGPHSGSGTFTIIQGRPDIIINGRRVAYKGAKTNDHPNSGKLVSASPNVVVS